MINVQPSCDCIYMSTYICLIYYSRPSRITLQLRLPHLIDRGNLWMNNSTLVQERASTFSSILFLSRKTTIYPGCPGFIVLSKRPLCSKNEDETTYRVLAQLRYFALLIRLQCPTSASRIVEIFSCWPPCRYHSSSSSLNFSIIHFQY